MPTAIAVDFATGLPAGTAYNVALDANPDFQTCGHHLLIYRNDVIFATGHFLFCNHFQTEINQVISMPEIILACAGLIGNPHFLRYFNYQVTYLVFKICNSRHFLLMNSRLRISHNTVVFSAGFFFGVGYHFISHIFGIFNQGGSFFTCFYQQRFVVAFQLQHFSFYLLCSSQ